MPRAVARRVLLLASLLPAVAAGAARQVGWPTGAVRHRFHDTPNGQLHYVTAGNVRTQRPLVYIHAHPRSGTEFKHVLAEMGGAVPFVAVDFFGMGQSEDYMGRDANDTFVTFEAMASYTLEILDAEGARHFDVGAFLKGCNPAIELAAQAGPRRVKKLVMMGPLILSASAMDHIKNHLIPFEKNIPVVANGSHVLKEWQNPSATDPDWSNPDDLLANQDKTNDALRCLFTGWQYQAGWAAYNARNEPRMRYVDSFAQTLFLYPDEALAKWQALGLDPQYSLDLFGTLLTHRNNMTMHLDGATEGMLEQNATLVAGLIKRFLR